MEVKNKILIVPSLYGEYCAQRLGEKLKGKGYEIKMVEGSFGEITGLLVISRSEYLTWKPDLVIGLGVGCIVIGAFDQAMRIMIDPDFHYSDFCKEEMHRYQELLDTGIKDKSKKFEIERAYQDFKHDAELAEKLEHKEKSLRGEKPMLCIFTNETGDMADYEDRYGSYEVNLDIDLNKMASLDIMMESIERFLKEANKKC